MTSDRSDATVFVDADNTLWDTDQVFAGAQLAMLAETELALELKAPPQDRLAFVRAIDQAIAARHHAGLRYPPRLLVRALSHALQGYGSEAAARAAWSGNIPAPLAGEAEARAFRRFDLAEKRCTFIGPRQFFRNGTAGVIVMSHAQGHAALAHGKILHAVNDGLGFCSRAHHGNHYSFSAHIAGPCNVVVFL